MIKFWTVGALALALAIPASAGAAERLSWGTAKLAQQRTLNWYVDQEADPGARWSKDGCERKSASRINCFLVRRTVEDGVAQRQAFVVRVKRTADGGWRWRAQAKGGPVQDEPARDRGARGDYDIPRELMPYRKG